jgi:6-phospho-beta-glucosidase
MSNRKVALIGGGGVRTPLVVFGVNESSRHLGVDEMVLYDLDEGRAQLMCALAASRRARSMSESQLTTATRAKRPLAPVGSRWACAPPPSPSSMES